jgi:hypothetical protein
MQKILLVDFENVQKLDLSQVPGDAHVRIFFGASQKSLPLEVHRAVKALGSRCVEIDIHGNGRNALDFHIAFYLGEYLTHKPTAELVILSKDKGFDPLVNHLQEQRRAKVRRVDALPGAFGAPTKNAPAGEEQPYSAVLKHLAGLQSKVLPKTRAKLVNHLVAAFKTMPSDQIEKIVDRLIRKGQIGETEKKLTYRL